MALSWDVELIPTEEELIVDCVEAGWGRRIGEKSEAEGIVLIRQFNSL